MCRESLVGIACGLWGVLYIYSTWKVIIMVNDLLMLVNPG